MITVCHLSTSRSERIVWLLEELGVPYELDWHQREANGAAPAAMREIHPIGKAPIIRDGDLVLAESGAIVEYIVQRYGKGRLGVPPESPRLPAVPLLDALRRGQPHDADADRARALEGP